jgi:hypothetical protein
MMKTIRVLALSLTLGIWATVSVDALNVKQIAQVAGSANLIKGGIINRSRDGTISLVGSSQRRSIDCEGHAIQITGNDGNITLQGICSEMVLVGNGNRIQLDTVGKISVTGNDNQIAWTSGMGDVAPQVARSGKNNLVVQTD